MILKLKLKNCGCGVNRRFQTLLNDNEKNY
jgi:hypothetical protein